MARKRISSEAYALRMRQLLQMVAELRPFSLREGWVDILGERDVRMMEAAFAVALIRRCPESGRYFVPAMCVR
jgi:hypothetical protein